MGYKPAATQVVAPEVQVGHIALADCQWQTNRRLVAVTQAAVQVVAATG